LGCDSDRHRQLDFERVLSRKRWTRSCPHASHSDQTRRRSRDRTGGRRTQMTYCLGMLCRAGAVFLSDSRTSAGMDNITMCSKMRIYEKPGDRVICILSSGNLSLTQATIALIDEDIYLGGSDPTRE